MSRLGWPRLGRKRGWARTTQRVTHSVRPIVSDPLVGMIVCSSVWGADAYHSESEHGKGLLAVHCAVFHAPAEGRRGGGLTPPRE